VKSVRSLDKELEPFWPSKSHIADVQRLVPQVASTLISNVAERLDLEIVTRKGSTSRARIGRTVFSVQPENLPLLTLIEKGSRDYLTQLRSLRGLRSFDLNVLQVIVGAGVCGARLGQPLVRAFLALTSSTAPQIEAPRRVATKLLCNRGASVFPIDVLELGKFIAAVEGFPADITSEDFVTASEIIIFALGNDL
jgi:hypothetical protein